MLHNHAYQIDPMRCLSDKEPRHFLSIQRAYSTKKKRKKIYIVMNFKNMVHSFSFRIEKSLGIQGGMAHISSV